MSKEIRSNDKINEMINGGEIVSRADMVGTVSQSGGVPTGAIIENGSNSNGDYTKFADGTLIVSMRGTENRSSSGVNTTTLTYPHVFSEDISDTGSVDATLNTSVPETATNISVSGTYSRTTIDILIDRSSTTNSAFYITVTGRWY